MSLAQLLVDEAAWDELCGREIELGREIRRKHRLDLCLGRLRLGEDLLEESVMWRSLRCHRNSIRSPRESFRSC